MTIVDFVIHYRSTSLQILYSMTLTYFLKINEKKNYICETVRANAKICEKHL